MRISLLILALLTAGPLLGQEPPAAGQKHEALRRLEGSWVAETKFWSSPSSTAVTASLQVENKLMLGGRYLQESLRGDLGGRPFEGFGLTGYNEYKKRYESVWVDSMSSVMLLQHGAPDPKGRKITWVGRYEDPLSARLKQIKSISNAVADDRHTFEMWDEAADGKPYKMLEMTYTRAR